MRVSRTGLVSLVAAALVFAASPASAQTVDATTLPCNTGPAVASADGRLRLAMIVGLSVYDNFGALEGAVKDAGRMYQLLVDSPTRVFPKENICVLTNSRATYDGFKAAFRKALIDRAQGAEEVLFYYAGHGSALDDDNGDESDGKDETLVLNDGRKSQRISEGLKYNQLRDDEFNGLLAEVHAKAKTVTVILDSCHSGSATRDFGEEKSRFVESESRQATRAAAGFAAEDRASFSEFQPSILKNAVILAAARDSEKAKETPNGGKFTKALVDVLRRPDAAKITYDQLMAQIAAAMAAADNRQNPVLTGRGDRFVFSSDIPYKPRFDWQIGQITPQARAARKLKIGGVPTIGMGLGAEFLILPGSMTPEEARKPDIAKARMRATAQINFREWQIQPVNAQQNLATIREGDWAQLVRPATAARQLRLRLRPADQAGGIANPAAFIEMMKTPFKDELGVAGAVGKSSLINFEATDYDFEISRNAAGALEVLDADGVLRNTLEKPADGGALERKELAQILSNHFQQITLLADWKPSGGELMPNSSIEATLVPLVVSEEIHRRASAPSCQSRPRVTRTDWPIAKNAPQRIPLCAFYQIKVKLDPAAPVSLKVAASALSANGDMLAYPRDPADPRVIDTAGVELRPGGAAGSEAVMRGALQADVESLGKPEYIYVLGLPVVARGEGTANFEAASAIPWHLLSTNKKRTRDPTTKPPEVNEREYGTYTILRIMTVEGQ